MRLLSPKLAKEIVQKMMQTVPYNLSITDQRGIILASGHDIGCIGQIHLGAIEALNRNSIVRVWADDGNLKRGISIPLVYKNKTIGVMAVEGDNVHQINKIIKLVKTCAEMLINQAGMLNMRQLKQQMKNQFLYEWIYHDGTYSPEFIERGHTFGLDIKQPRRSITIFGSDEKALEKSTEKVFEIIESNDAYVRLSSDKYAVLIIDNHKVRLKTKRLSNLYKKFKLSVSTPNTQVSVSVQESLQALRIGLVLFPDENLYRAEDLVFIHPLLQSPNNTPMVQKIDDLVKYGKTADLLETLVIYIQQNGEIQKTVDILNIHRNSLDYRMKRITEITGKNPRNYLDMLYLYCAYIAYMFRNTPNH